MVLPIAVTNESLNQGSKPVIVLTNTAANLTLLQTPFTADDFIIKNGDANNSAYAYVQQHLLLSLSQFDIILNKQAYFANCFKYENIDFNSAYGLFGSPPPALTTDLTKSYINSFFDLKYFHDIFYQKSLDINVNNFLLTLKYIKMQKIISGSDYIYSVTTPKAIDSTAPYQDAHQTIKIVPQGLAIIYNTSADLPLYILPYDNSLTIKTVVKNNVFYANLFKSADLNNPKNNTPVAIEGLQFFLGNDYKPAVDFILGSSLDNIDIYFISPVFPITITQLFKTGCVFRTKVNDATISNTDTDLNAHSEGRAIDIDLTELYYKLGGLFYFKKNIFDLFETLLNQYSSSLSIDTSLYTTNWGSLEATFTNPLKQKDYKGDTFTLDIAVDKKITRGLYHLEVSPMTQPLTYKALDVRITDSRIVQL